MAEHTTPTTREHWRVEREHFAGFVQTLREIRAEHDAVRAALPDTINTERERLLHRLEINTVARLVIADGVFRYFDVLSADDLAAAIRAFDGDNADTWRAAVLDFSRLVSALDEAHGVSRKGEPS